MLLIWLLTTSLCHRIIAPHSKFVNLYTLSTTGDKWIISCVTVSPTLTICVVSFGIYFQRSTQMQPIAASICGMTRFAFEHIAVVNDHILAYISGIPTSAMSSGNLAHWAWSSLLGFILFYFIWSVQDDGAEGKVSHWTYSYWWSLWSGCWALCELCEADNFQLALSIGFELLAVWITLWYLVFEWCETGWLYFF